MLQMKEVYRWTPNLQKKLTLQGMKQLRIHFNMINIYSFLSFLHDVVKVNLNALSLIILISNCLRHNYLTVLISAQFKFFKVNRFTQSKIDFSSVKTEMILSFLQKQQQKFSALASKKRSNQKSSVRESKQNPPSSGIE